MAKFVDEMAKCGGIWRNISKIWRATGEMRRELAEKCEILTESGGKQQNLAKYCAKGRNLAKYIRIKNDETQQNLTKNDAV